MKFKIGMLVVLLISTSVMATSYTQDSGKISSLYANAGGSVAVKLDSGFLNAVAGNQCSNIGPNGWAGNNAADPLLKSALLAAKTSNQNVVLTVQGCESGGAWFKLIDIYLK
jgi:hypothetical protein